MYAVDIISAYHLRLAEIGSFLFDICSILDLTNWIECVNVDSFLLLLSKTECTKDWDGNGGNKEYGDKAPNDD